MVSVDGREPDRCITPELPDEAAEMLAQAVAHGEAVSPVGSGTKLSLGNPPERLNVALMTSGLSGIIDYEPGDLVLSVGAGTRLADVQAVLGEHGQWLPITVPDGELATIGGLIATAIAGPRRLGSGTLRDLLLGLSVASPDGSVTKSGGMVVKNVTGFDLPRLHHGALGTLGLIVSANFKVLPMPKAELTLVASSPTLEKIMAACRAVRASVIQPTALEVARLGEDWTLAIQLEGREATITSVSEQVRGLIGLDAESLTGNDSRAWWTHYLARQSLRIEHDAVLLRLATRPRDTLAVVASVETVLTEAGLAGASVMASPGLGSMLIQFAVTEPIEDGWLIQLRHQLAAMYANVQILCAPPEVKRGLDVWGEAPEGIDVMRSLKAQFDPRFVLNPGRFIGGI